jgi:hypothetical protein
MRVSAGSKAIPALARDRATYVLARRQLEGLELLTSDHRLAEAARVA